MSDVDDCKYWRSEVLRRHRKMNSRIAHLSKPSYVPDLFRTEFEEWRELPLIDYKADVTKLYNMQAMEKELQTHPCLQKEAEAAQEEGVSYPTTFYLGLALAGIGVIYSFAGGRK